MNLETDPKLYDLLVNNPDFPEGAEYQVPLIFRAVLLGQEKCYASLVGRHTRVTNAAFSPPAGARAQRTPAPPATVSATVDCCVFFLFFSHIFLN